MEKRPFDYYSKDLDDLEIEHRTRKELAKLHGEALDGSQEAWHELWVYGTKLVLKIANKLRSQDLLRMDFDDAVAEGNRAIGEALTRWKPAKSSFGTWVWIQVRGYILDEIKSEAKEGMVGSVEGSPLIVGLESRLEGDYDADDDGDILVTDLVEDGITPDNAEDAVQRQELYEAISQLSPREQRYIISVYMEDQSQAELAALEGISPRMVRKVLARALDNLRNLLEQGSS